VKVVHLPARRAARTGVAVLVVAAALTACGGSGSSSAGATTTPSAASSTGGAAARAGRFDPAEMQKIRDCLSAAGISLPTPSGGFRSVNPSDRPSVRPSRTRPPGSPSGGFRGQDRGFFADPQARAALEACGITLPTGRPTGGPANPSASPTATG
jgi:hypothetical protein